MNKLFIFMFSVLMGASAASATSLSKEDVEIHRCMNVPNECTMSFPYGFDFDLYSDGKLMWVSRVKEDSMKLIFILPKQEGDKRDFVFVVRRELTAQKNGSLFSFSEEIISYKEKVLRESGQTLVIPEIESCKVLFDAKRLSDKEIELKDFSCYKNRKMDYVLKIKKSE